jgi:SPP1 family predicted phage head-tail adaptor
VRAGELRHRVTFQARSTITDTFGAQSTVWADVATVWADIATLSGRELFAAQSVNAEITHAVTIRYQPQFSGPKAVAAMRISYCGRLFNIHASLDKDERRKELTLSVSEGLNNG